MTMTWFSKKIEKRESGIDGIGLWCVLPITRGEIVVVKGGHVFDRAKRDELAKTLGPAEIQIGDHLFIGPAAPKEREGAMMYLNHSCAPNLGIDGQIIFRAMRDIKPGEALSFDYATGDDDDWAMDCNCGAPSCRRRVTGKDWRIPEVQEKYAAWFSTYLNYKINNDLS